MASSSSAPSPLLYSCIAYHTTILTEHTASSSAGTSSLASLVLPKISHAQSQKLSYQHNQNLVHYIADSRTDHPAPADVSAGGLTFLVVAKEEVGKRVPFGYLLEIRRRFLQQYDTSRTDFSTLPPYGAAAFNGRMRELMVEYGTTKAGQDDAIGKAQREIQSVREIMTENIERVLERGERIDLLVDKTDRLGGTARDFRVRSRGLRRRMWWKNVRLMALLIAVVVFLIYLSLALAADFRVSWFLAYLT